MYGYVVYIVWNQRPSMKKKAEVLRNFLVIPEFSWYIVPVGANLWKSQQIHSIPINFILLVLARCWQNYDALDVDLAYLWFSHNVSGLQQIVTYITRSFPHPADLADGSSRWTVFFRVTLSCLSCDVFKCRRAGKLLWMWRSFKYQAGLGGAQLWARFMPLDSQKKMGSELYIYYIYYTLL